MRHQRLSKIWDGLFIKDWKFTEIKLLMMAISKSKKRNNQL